MPSPLANFAIFAFSEVKTSNSACGPSAVIQPRRIPASDQWTAKGTSSTIETPGLPGNPTNCQTASVFASNFVVSRTANRQDSENTTTLRHPFLCSAPWL